jgi:hypothetical protein
MKAPILMTEEYWRNSHLSIARYYGQIQFNGNVYVIVNKRGITIFDLSDPKSEHYVGDGAMAIPPGDPADLVLISWAPVYKAVGRKRIIEMIEQGITLEEAEREAGIR